MHHLAHTGDLPNTVSSTAQGSMMISPHNYLDIDPSRQTYQQVEIKFMPGIDNTATVNEFGKYMATCYADTVSKRTPGCAY